MVIESFVMSVAKMGVNKEVTRLWAYWEDELL